MEDPGRSMPQTIIGILVHTILNDPIDLGRVTKGPAAIDFVLID